MISQLTEPKKLSVRWLQRFPDVIRYFRHENRLGPGGNYQFLIGQARGEYIAHLDGDDYWLPGKLTAQLGVLDVSPECVAVYANAICVNDAGALLGFSIIRCRKDST